MEKGNISERNTKEGKVSRWNARRVPEGEERSHRDGAAAGSNQSSRHEVNGLRMPSETNVNSMQVQHAEIWSASNACRRPSVYARTAVETSALVSDVTCQPPRRNSTERTRRHTHDNASIVVSIPSECIVIRRIYQDRTHGNPDHCVYRCHEGDDADDGQRHLTNPRQPAMMMRSSIFNASQNVRDKHGMATVEAGWRESVV